MRHSILFLAMGQDIVYLFSPTEQEQEKDLNSTYKGNFILNEGH